MSYNQNYTRHNSVGGNWHLPPPQGYNNGPFTSDTQKKQDGAPLQQQQQHVPGFRNPWFSGSQSSSIPSGFPSMSQSPTKGQGIPLLQQQSKRMSFANQLPTTYEYDSQIPSNAPSVIHPPTRADNPFGQYYTNQEVSLNTDRKMSAVETGNFFNSYNAFPGHGVGNDYHLYNSGLASGLQGNYRRSSISVTNSHHYPSDDRNFIQTQSKVGRSPSIVQYQKYQQSLQTRSSSRRRNSAPKATRVHSISTLNPRVHHQPKYRRCSVHSLHISPVNALSIYLTETYGICQPKKFQYSKSTNPKRVLTKPSEPKFNNGYDNSDSDYILYVNDILGTEEGRKYIVLDLLGSGTFGQVVKCQNLSNQSLCAVKVIKSKPAYMNQSLTEVRLLEFLNANTDGKNFIRLLDAFMHKEHLCLVFELLASNLYELIKQNQFQGLNMKLVKILTRQLLESMSQLKNFQMIHCDLKPENILLCQPDKPDIKVIDFGSACFTRQTVYSYIQSRFYRSPEVLLGLPYTESIDMWSLGCIVGELFLGLPMFPGTSEYNQVYKIVDMLGYPPRHMIEVGRNAFNYFEKSSVDADNKAIYQLRPYDDYITYLRTVKGKEEQSKKEQKNRNYFKHRLLKDIILNYKLPSKKMTTPMIEKECQERLQLVDFLSKVLNLNPLERLTPQEALKHPFVSNVRSSDFTPSAASSDSFKQTEYFAPKDDLSSKMSSVTPSHAVGNSQI